VSDEFYLDLPEFRRVTKSMGEVGAHLEFAYRQLVDVLDHYKGCWGDDEIGKGFQKSYYKRSEATRKNADEAGGGLVIGADYYGRKAEMMYELDEEAARKLDAYKKPQD
jgi:hypothetical protein